MTNHRFRPLDGESFSKLSGTANNYSVSDNSFRPLDGESFSKQSITQMDIGSIWFPSPRRGIIF